MKTSPFPWMNQEEYDLYCAMCAVSNALVTCLVEKNREGWLRCCRIMHHISGSQKKGAF